MATDLRKVHFVVSTHWDREWYQSFQGFRYRLVRMFDEVLETMEKDPRFTHFDTDGQAIVLEDYLAIRPERTEKVKELIRQGRLSVGPWYVLPDEFLVSGESLIRNLKEGIRVAESFGKSSRAGFVCDIFGHTSQVPQILRGFGINSFLMWRGMNEKVCSANFRWQSPDGSEVLTHRFGPMWGYCDYDFRVRKAQQISAKPTQEELVEGLIEEVHLQAQRTSTRTLLIFDGGDHIEIEPSTPALIEEANKRLEAEGFRIEMSSLPRYTADIAAEEELITDVITGELREPSNGVDEQWIIPGVLSSRIHQKQKNRECENLLCQWAEPFSAMARYYGLKGSESFLQTAWRLLLENHPHDSICGCSIDQVHKDMEFRFDQAAGIANEVIEDALQHMIRSIPGEVTSRRFPVLVANPLPFARKEVVDLTLEIPSDCPTYQEFFGFEPKPGFRLYTSDGQELPYQLVHQDMNRTRFIRKLRKFPHGIRRHLVDVSLQLELPALGTRTLWVETVEGPTRHPGEGLASGRFAMENGYLAVDIAPNGTVTIQDLETGTMFSSLLELEDCADIGDGWYHGMAVNEEIFTSQGSPAAISLVHNGPEKTTFRIEVSMEVPACFDFHRMVRSAERKTLKVTHWITLRKDARHLEVTTEVDNTACDHRLRVLLPSFFEVDTFWSDVAFDYQERQIALREDNYTYKELEVETKPQYTWTAIVGEGSFSDEDAKGGLAVISCGLPESTVLDTENREIALTLLRAFQKAVFTDGNEGGQIQGKHCFHYWIVPFTGDLDPVVLGKAGQILSGGIRTAQSHPYEEPLQGNPHPDTFSLLNVSGPVLVTSVRPAGDRDLFVRLYNPVGDQVEAELSIHGGVASARICNLLDEPVEKVSAKKGKVILKVAGKKIVNIRLTPGD